MARQLATAAANVLRDNHRVLNPVTGLYERATLLEGSRTNLISRNHQYGSSTSGWSKAGDAAATLAAVNDAAALADVGLDALISDQTVLKLDNTAGSTTAYAIITTSTTNTAHSASVWARGGAGRLNHSGSIGEVSFAASASYRRVVSRNFTALSGAGSVRVVAEPGQVVYFVLAQLEEGPFESSEILTAGATATRAADALSFPFPWAPQEMTLYARFVERGAGLTGFSRLLSIGNTADARLMLGANSSGTRYRLYHGNGSSNVQPTPNVVPVMDALTELHGVLYADGSVELRVSVNGGAAVSSGRSTPLALAPAWSTPKLWVGSENGLNPGFAAFLAVKVAAGIKSLDQMRLLPPVS